MSLASPSLAQEQGTAPIPRASQAQPDKQRMPQLLSTEELAKTRGGHTIILNNQTLTSIMSGETLGNYTAGSITLSDNALSNFNGVGNFVINTGAQNSLQAGMTLTVNVNN